ncbi:MAG: RluA family pseudouridine synthase [bacterium]
MVASDPPKVKIVEAVDADAGQRIDNFLLKRLKGVPRTRIYKALRKGEVRVNGSRKKPTYQVVPGDRIRIPPIRHRDSAGEVVVPDRLLDQIPVLYEDQAMLVVNKPAGLAVHGGSGLDYGLIEAIRKLRPDLAFIELVHRLDRETSGCLMLAKSRLALIALQSQLSESRTMRKHYVALVKGQLGQEELIVKLPLAQTRSQNGIKRVVVQIGGQPSHTVFRSRQVFAGSTLVEVELKTGRMHQVRVHAASSGHPIAGDRLYGEKDFNRQMKKLGNRRLFLHAERLRLQHPESGTTQDLYAPLPVSLEQVIKQL